MCFQFLMICFYFLICRMLISFHEFELYKKVIKEVSLCLPILSSPFYLFRGNHPHCFLVYPSWISFCKNLKKKHFALFSPSSSQKKVRYMLYMLFCMWFFHFFTPHGNHSMSGHSNCSQSLSQLHHTPLCVSTIVYSTFFYS